MLPVLTLRTGPWYRVARCESIQPSPGLFICYYLHEDKPDQHLIYPALVQQPQRETAHAVDRPFRQRRRHFHT